MKRLLCGSVVLAASMGLVSCNGDPTSEFRDGPSQIFAEPSTVFIDQGDVQEVIVRVVDEAGDPLAAEWEVTNPGSGISVERNPNFQPTTAGAPLESEAQFIVTAGASPGATSFTVSVGDISTDIAVNIMPASLGSATFSNATPALNEPVTLTAEGFTFLPDAVVTVGTGPAGIVGNDGTSITFVPQPGSTGPALIDNVAVNFLPDIPLSLTTDAEITVPAGPVGGTEDPATAPVIPNPPPGGQSFFFDNPDFAATPDHWYQLTVTEAGLYTISVDWDIGSDIDLIICEGQPAADFSNCPLFSFASHPEVVEAELAPGTYLILVEDFTGIDPGIPDAVGSTVEIHVTHAPLGGDLKRAPTTTDVRKLQRSLKK